MKTRALLAGLLCLSSVIPLWAEKKHGQRAMIEKMEAVPCGAKEKGLSGLGALWGSIGITSINVNEKMCPQYMLRTDDMEYHIRPLDKKHPRLLPVGQEGEIKVNKDSLEMRIPDGDRKKRRYQVVGMKPIDHTESPEVGSNNQMNYHKPQTAINDKPLADKVPSIRPY